MLNQVQHNDKMKRQPNNENAASLARERLKAASKIIVSSRRSVNVYG
jgi:hypothetical protein